MNTARVQLFTGPGRPFEASTAALPDELADGEVLVAISLATICGSDLHTFEGRRSAPTPCVLGHEAVGHVVASSRPGLIEGQRVTWTLADSCGHCVPCTQWHLPQKCDRLFKYGHAALSDGSGLNGCYASHILLRPGTAVLPVPLVLSDAVAAPANCALATIINALALLPSPCHSALVQGGGLLGLYACAWLRHRGVETVYCTDVNAGRLAMVRDFGGLPLSAHPDHWAASCRQVRDATAGGVDLAIEVAGAASVVKEGVGLLRPGGTYVWAGMVHPETRLDLTGEAIVRKCLTIRGVHNYAPEHLAAALHFLVQNHSSMPFENLVSPPLALDQLNAAIALSQERGWLRVSVRP